MLVVVHTVRLIAPPYCCPTSGVDPVLVESHVVLVCAVPADPRCPDPMAWTVKPAADEPSAVFAPSATVDHVVAVSVDPRLVVYPSLVAAQTVSVAVVPALSREPSAVAVVAHAVVLVPALIF